MQTACVSSITLADRALGILVLTAGILIIIAARSTAWLLPLVTAATLAAMFLERQSLGGLTQIGPSNVLIALLLGLALLSATWAADPLFAFSHAIMALFMLFQWQLLTTWVSVQPMRRVRHLSYWLPIAVLIGLAILTFEVYGHQYIRRSLMENYGILSPPTLGRHFQIGSDGEVNIFDFELNRSIAAANMIVWPALLCASSWWSGRKLVLIGIVFVGGVTLATFGSNHETSKIAVVLAIVTFAMAKLIPRMAIASLTAGWLISTFSVVPASLVAYERLQLNSLPWLQFSAQERIIIWGDFGRRVIEAPWFGAGVRTAYVLSERGVASLEKQTGQPRVIANHAHNVNLQVWYELGFVGAALFAAAGLSVLLVLSKLAETTQPYALATFAAFLTEIGSSWEIWQRWFFALFVLIAFFVKLGIRSVEKDQQSARRSM